MTDPDPTAAELLWGLLNMALAYAGPFVLLAAFVAVVTVPRIIVGWLVAPIERRRERSDEAGEPLVIDDRGEWTL